VDWQLGSVEDNQPGKKVEPQQVICSAGSNLDSHATGSFLFKNQSLLSKPGNILRGPISFIGVNARKENLITALSALWHSSGFVSFSPVGKPTSLTTNPSILRPSQKGNSASSSI
jgi:hypothetical protein